MSGGLQRIRIRSTKLGRTRFLSARDLTSVWERSLRRAQLPIAYSQGFTPHAKVSFPDALPVGLASTAEYLELTFAAPVDPAPALGALSAALPVGMDVTTYLEVPDGAPKLARMLRATTWELVWPGPERPDGSGGAVVERLRAAAAALLASEQAEVVKHRPSGDKVLDVRPPLVAVDVGVAPTPPWRDTAAATDVPVLRAVLHDGAATVRPDDLVAALRGAADDASLPAPSHACRLARGRVDEHGLVEALTGVLVPLAPRPAVRA